MGSPTIQLNSGFSKGYFTRLAEMVEPNLSKRKNSSLAPLIAMLNQLPEGFQNFSIQQREQIQELIFFIPYDKQQKYKTALAHLTSTAKLKICGRPVDFGMGLAYFGVGGWNYMNAGTLTQLNPGSYHHVFRTSWKSSTGNLASLKEVGIREWVVFRSPPSGPPFNYTQHAVPLQFTMGESLDSNHFGQGLDDHSTKSPRVICSWPRVAGELVAEQWYQYTIDRGVTWKNIPGAAYLITKGVRVRANQAFYFFRKMNWQPHNPKVYHFEVEYLIEPPPPSMPPVNTVLSMQSGTEADLKNYAYKIIHKGKDYCYNPD